MRQITLFRALLSLLFIPLRGAEDICSNGECRQELAAPSPACVVQRSQHRHMLWWLPVEGYANVQGNADSDLALFAPLQDDLYDKKTFPLSYNARIPAGCRVAIFLDGGEVLMHKMRTDYVDTQLHAEPGLHYLQLTVLRPAHDVDFESDEPQEDMLLQVIVSFTVVESLPSGPPFRYPAMDTFCRGFNPSQWNHHCKSAESPAANTQAVFRFAELASPDACCAVLQVSMLTHLQPAPDAAARVEALGRSFLVRGNRTEVFCTLESASTSSISMILLDEDGVEVEGSVQQFKVALPECTHGYRIRPVEPQVDEPDVSADSEPQHDTAWVTLVFAEEYLVGAMTVMHSISVHCTGKEPRERVMLCVEGMVEPAAVEAAVAGSGVRVEWVPALLSPHEQMAGREDLRYAYSKLRVWALHEYKQVVYVDADVILYWCLDDLFNTTAHFSAGTFPISEKFEKYDESTGRWTINYDSLGFGTWMFTALPTPQTYDRLLEEAQYMGSFDGSDGGLLYNLFRERFLMAPYVVAWKRTVWRFKSLWQRYPVGGMDFTGKPKPWQPEWLNGKDPVDGVGYFPLYLDWWERRWDAAGLLPNADLNTWTSGVGRALWPHCAQ